MSIYGLLLAAGASSRMGRPKQLLNWHGQPLICHVAQQALAAPIAGLVVVVGAAADQVRAALAKESRLTIVENPAYVEGLAGSLRVGLNVLPANATAALVLLVDQPLITAKLITTFIQAFATPQQSGEAPLALVPRYHGQRGNPVLLARELFEELKALEGDTGAREILQRYASRILWFDTDDPAVVTDADTPEAYQRIYQMGRG